MPSPFTPPYNFPPDTQRMIEQAGWYPGRTVDVTLPTHVVYPPEVLAFVREFGGLKVGRITFEPFAGQSDYDAEGEFEEFALLEVGRMLYCIGENNEYNRIVVDLHGSVYLLTYDHLVLMGMTLAEGVRNVLRAEPGLYFNPEDQTWGQDHRVITWPTLPHPPPGSGNVAT